MKRSRWMMMAVLAGGGSLSAGCAGTNRDKTATVEVTEDQSAALARLQSQTGSAWRIALGSTLTAPMHLEGRAPSLLRKGDSASSVTLRFLADHRSLFNMGSPEDELSLLREKVDALGMTHVRLTQHVDGVPVHNSQVWAHYDASGALTVVDSHYVPGLAGMATTPKVEAPAAVVSAESSWKALRADFNPKFYWRAPTSQLVIYPHPSGARLAWHTRLFLIGPSPSMPDYMIDALTGEVIDYFDNLQTETGTGLASNQNDTRALQITLGDGTSDAGVGGFNDAGYDLDGEHVKLPPVAPPLGVYGLIDMTRSPKGIRTFSYEKNPTAQCAADEACQLKFYGDYLTGTLVTSADKTSWDTAAPGSGAAVDAHFFAGVVYDYYKQKHNRESIDGLGLEIRSAVHFSVGYDNAFWNGEWMTYGDGTQFATMTGGVDVVGHEMTHGVTSYESNLVYKDQSGALDESISDIFGCFIEHEFHDDPVANWQIGEALAKPPISSGPVRDLSRPRLENQPDNMRDYNSFADASADRLDNGGVHFNSGIPNNAAYLMTMGGTNETSKVEVKRGIGWAKAEQLWYRAATQYLLPTADFAAAAQATLTAASDISLSDEEKAIVECAWIAVGVVKDKACSNSITSADGGGLVADAGVDTGPPDAGPATTVTTTTTTSGCSCGVPSSGGPVGRGALLFGAALAWVASRRRRTR